MIIDVNLNPHQAAASTLLVKDHFVLSKPIVSKGATEIRVANLTSSTMPLEHFNAHATRSSGRADSTKVKLISRKKQVHKPAASIANLKKSRMQLRSNLHSMNEKNRTEEHPFEKQLQNIAAVKASIVVR